MPIKVRPVDRDQVFLMPPSMTEWLPDGHLAWFGLDVVAELDLVAFEAQFRADGRGGAVYDPAMMLAVLLYAYCSGERSSRRIERRLVEDVAYRVLAGNQRPDHATLAWFRRRHEVAVAELFDQLLGLCVREGLVDAGLIAIDGTKLAANASAWANRSRRQIAEEILAEAEDVDATEDARLGDRRGDELPARWADRRGRRSRLREALRQLESAGPADWESMQAKRAAKEAELGRKLPGRKPKPEGRRGKERHANVTDPDSRMLRAGQRFVQGYNAQAAVTAEQVIVAAEVGNHANDTTWFVPMLHATRDTLRRAGHDGEVAAVVADTGYWSASNAAVETTAVVLIPPVRPTNTSLTDDDPRLRTRAAVLERLARGEITSAEAGRQMGLSDAYARMLLADYRKTGLDPALLRAQMDEKLANPHNAELYAKRKITVEPVFGQIKENRNVRRFTRRGLTAVNSEWKLICGTHNLLKLWRHQTAIAG